MKKKLETMTPAQEVLVPVYRKRWLDNGYRTDSIDHEKSIAAVEWVYREILERKEKPRVTYGEATGHAHRIRMFRHEEGGGGGGDWQVLRNKDTGDRFLCVKGRGVEIDHEEHKTVSLPPGNYKIGIVREYDHFTEEARQVVD